MYYYEKSGTGTWWGRNFVSMALTFKLATVTLCKMGALLEKLVEVESGAKSYVKLILGWVLPAHIITPENLRVEGRDAQAGMGSRMATGAAALAYHMSEGAPNALQIHFSIFFY